MPTESESVRIRAARFALRTLELGVYAVGAVVGSPYARLVGLRSAAERALANDDTEDAEFLAKELLGLAGRYRDDFFYGNALHNGHEILGLVHLKRGDPVAAERELLMAGQTPGSPQLNSFGPNLTLARDLLLEGRREAVLEYLELCRGFWCQETKNQSSTHSEIRLDGWVEEIRRGAVPDFGPNLVY